MQRLPGALPRPALFPLTESKCLCPAARAFFAALTSRSCSAPHPEHPHRLTSSALRPASLEPLADTGDREVRQIQVDADGRTVARRCIRASTAGRTTRRPARGRSSNSRIDLTQKRTILGFFVRRRLAALNGTHLRLRQLPRLTRQRKCLSGGLLGVPPPPIEWRHHPWTSEIRARHQRFLCFHAVDSTWQILRSRISKAKRLPAAPVYKPPEIPRSQTFLAAYLYEEQATCSQVHDMRNAARESAAE